MSERMLLLEALYDTMTTWAQAGDELSRHSQCSECGEDGEMCFRWRTVNRRHLNAMIAMRKAHAAIKIGTP